DLDATIQSVLNNYNSPGGVAVTVVQKNEQGSDWTVETKGYGVAKPDGTEVTENTLFAIQSNSK
ncbi:hypothetical protein DFH07DRAFT_700299, partial [Mycena maculata]